jgi:hypothetical protein
VASVFHRTDGIYFPSVNTPDFDPATWIINPDTSAVAGQPTKYWIIDPPGSDTIRLADAGEQAAIDAQIADDLNVQDQTAQKDAYVTQRVLEGMALVLLDEINILRDQFNTTTAEVPSATDTNLTDRTASQARIAVNNKIDSLPPP